MLRFVKFIAFITVFIEGTYLHAKTLNIAVASNFNQPLSELVSLYQSSSNQQINIISGSSAKMYAQIINGAPFDVFFSADQDKVERLANLNLIQPSSRFTYAIGRLVLWSGDPALNLNESYLAQGNFQRLAVANPKLAPYGVAAQSVLEKLKLSEALKKRLVFGENINQTFQFVVSKNAQIGFVALAQTRLLSKSDRGSFWLVPSDYHHPIAQDVSIINRSKNKVAAEAFLEFIQSAPAKKIIQAYGYQLSSDTSSIEGLLHVK